MSPIKEAIWRIRHDLTQIRDWPAEEQRNRARLQVIINGLLQLVEDLYQRVYGLEAKAKEKDQS